MGKQRGRSETHAPLCRLPGCGFGAAVHHQEAVGIAGDISPAVQAAASTSRRAQECLGCTAVHGGCLPAACTTARDYAATCSRQGPHATSHMVIT